MDLVDIKSVMSRFNVQNIDHFDTCCQKVAADLDKDISTIYEELLSLIKESPDNIYIDGIGIVPRKFPNANIMNRDPDKYIIENISSTNELERLVKIASYLYYNYDGGGITDNTFDAFQYNLNKRLKAKKRFFEKIGAEPIEKIRTKLPYSMPSLNKVKPDNIELYKFIELSKNNKSAITWSSKLDGVSGMIVYKSGIVSKIYTRGDGNIGGDVTYLNDYIKNIPQKLDGYKSLVVRGEFIITKSKWNEKYANQKNGYSNARSLVSGLINSGSIRVGLQDIDFIAYSILKIEKEQMLFPPSKLFKILTAQKFTVVDNGKFIYPTIQDIITKYKSKRIESSCHIDGLVLSQNIELPSMIKRKPGQDNIDPINPIFSVAFKMLLEEQMRDSTIINVEWNISRYGRFVPVAIYESVYIDGTRLHRASAHNAKHIRDWSMGIGTKIKVVKSGDVIPMIKYVDIDENIEPIYPESKPGYEWKWNNIDIVLKEIDTNPTVIMARNYHFFSTIDVSGLGEKTIENLYNSGFSTIASIARAKPKDFIKVKGIGKVKSESFYNTIKKSMSTISIDRYFVAITGFTSNLGRVLIKRLFQNIPNALELSSDELTTILKKHKISGFGPVRIKDVSENMPKIKELLYSINKEYIDACIQHYKMKLENIKHNGANPKIDGKKFVLSGFMGNVNYDFEDYIYLNRGEFSDQVDKNVDAVVVAYAGSSSSKIGRAIELGIKILTIEEFSIRYDIDLAKFKNTNITPIKERISSIKS